MQDAPDAAQQWVWLRSAGAWVGAVAGVVLAVLLTGGRVWGKAWLADREQERGEREEGRRLLRDNAEALRELRATLAQIKAEHEDYDRRIGALEREKIARDAVAAADHTNAMRIANDIVADRIDMILKALQESAGNVLRLNPQRKADGA